MIYMKALHMRNCPSWFIINTQNLIEFLKDKPQVILKIYSAHIDEDFPNQNMIIMQIDKPNVPSEQYEPSFENNNLVFRVNDNDCRYNRHNK